MYIIQWYNSMCYCYIILKKLPTGKCMHLDLGGNINIKKRYEMVLFIISGYVSRLIVRQGKS